MNYSDGSQIDIGDKVEVENGIQGVIVAVLDSHKFSGSYPESEWDYLKQGIIVLTESMGPVHYPKIEHEMKLIARANMR